jgi:hypothetical protein
MEHSDKIKITENLFFQIQSTIGAKKPETGGILGSKDGTILDSFIFDENAKVGMSEYSPNVKFLNSVINQNWLPQKISFLGFVHSHPFNSLTPSTADIEYSIRIMKNFSLKFLYLPIVSPKTEGQFKIVFYIVFLSGRYKKNEYEIIKSSHQINHQKKLYEIGENEEDINNLSEEEISNYFENYKVKSTNLSVTAPENNSIKPIFQRIHNAIELDHLSQCTVIGVGCGGAREFYLNLARIGVESFVLIDGDSISESNIGTQHAYQDEIGQKKVHVIKAKLQNINKDIRVNAYDIYFTERQNDQWFETNVLKSLDSKKILLCAFTDDFFVQARLNRIAIKYKLPFISAQHHENGDTSEIFFSYPELTESCQRCYLNERYISYKNNTVKSITSQGSPIFNTNRLNSLCEKISLGLLTFSKNSESPFCSFLKRNKNRNFIVIQQVNLFNKTSLFSPLFSKNGNDHYFDDSYWLSVNEIRDYKPNSCDDCCSPILNSNDVFDQ